MSLENFEGFLTSLISPLFFTGADKLSSISGPLVNTIHIRLSQPATVAPADSMWLPPLYSPAHWPEIDIESPMDAVH